MSNNKQTSVEQLFHKLWDTPKDKFTWYAILEEHMAMHKKEIVDAYYVDNEKNEGFKYYNAIYGGGEQ